jgi:hypothetical protein
MPSKELQELVETGDWVKYSRIRFSGHLRHIEFISAILAVLLLVSFRYSYLFLIPSLFFVYVFLFDATQMYFYHQIQKNPNYRENKFSKFLYGGK